MSFKHACQRRGSSAPLAAAHVRPHSGLQKCPPHTENSGSPRKRRSGFLPERGPCCASQVPGDTKGEWREAPSWGLWALVASGETPRCLPSASRPGPGTKAVFTRGDGAEFQTGPAPDPRPLVGHPQPQGLNLCILTSARGMPGKRDPPTKALDGSVAA